MRDTEYDVAVVGGGLAGSAAAAMIGRSGLTACLIDPHRDYPADFRCEALTQGQLDLLAAAGLLDQTRAVMTASNGLWIARRGRIVERRDSCLYGIHHRQLVMRLRDLASPRVPLVEGNIAAIENGPHRQVLRLTDGRSFSARLVVLATGGNVRLRRALGMTQTEYSPVHSVSLGFDVVPAANGRFSVPALTYHAESTAARMAYLSLFPIGSTMRANLFVYRGVHDPWLKQLQRHPRAALTGLMPNLQNVIGDYEIAGPIQVRPIGLYEVSNAVQPGVVLVGDAFGNSCPAAGTGCDKLLVDVERLCNHHLPHWFATEGIPAAKIRSFYDDPVKTARDARSRTHAFYTRAVAVNDDLKWRAIRLAKGVVPRLLALPLAAARSASRRATVDPGIAA